jgi:hypothetical protein
MPRGRAADRALIKSSNQEGRLEIGEPVVVKFITGVNPGDPARGISPSYVFRHLPTRAIIESITQVDVMQSGGLYALGDIKVQLDETLKEVIDKTANIGDRVLWQNNEYRVVGKRQPETLLGRTWLFSYTMRKVGD